jgi:hypothetical protein
MGQEFLTFGIRLPGGGFRLVQSRISGKLIAPAKGLASWRRLPLGTKGRDRLLAELTELSAGSAPARELLAFCNRYGRFGTTPLEVSARGGELLDDRGESLSDIRIELALWRGLRKLRATLDAGQSVDAFMVLASGSGEVPRWRGRLPLTEKERRTIAERERALHMEVVARDGELVDRGVPDEGRTPADAAQTWLDRIVEGYLGRWAKWGRQELQGRYGIRVETVLGIAWHAFATGPAPRLCRREGCGVVFTPSLYNRRPDDATYHNDACARWGQRHGIKVRPRRRARREP